MAALSIQSPSMGVIHVCDVFVRYPSSIFNEMIRFIFLFLFLFLFLFKSRCNIMLCYFAFYYNYFQVFSLPYEYVVVVDNTPTAIPTNSLSINVYVNQFQNKKNQ